MFSVIEKDIPTVFQPAISSFCSCLSSHQSTATITVMGSRAVIMVIDYCIEFDVVPKYKFVEG